MQGVSQVLAHLGDGTAACGGICCPCAEREREREKREACSKSKGYGNKILIKKNFNHKSHLLLCLLLLVVGLSHILLQ